MSSNNVTSKTLVGNISSRLNMRDILSTTLGRLLLGVSFTPQVKIVSESLLQLIYLYFLSTIELTPSPCLNGVICQDLCEHSYHLCHCPSGKQGDNCEWDIRKYCIQLFVAKLSNG